MSQDRTELLYKKFLGTPDGLPGTSYTSEVGSANIHIFAQTQLFSQPIPPFAPTDLVISGYVTITNGNTVIVKSDPGSGKLGTIYTSVSYPWVQKITYLQLQQATPFSYYFNNPVSSLNLLQNAIPFNYDLGGSYNYSLFSTNTSTLELLPGKDPKWFIDADAGYLYFPSRQDDWKSYYGTQPFISFYRYNGTFGIPTNIGNFAGAYSQGTGAMAIGNFAGAYSQGTGAIAIGLLAGPTGMTSNSIALNASGVDLSATGPTGGFYVAPIVSNINSTGPFSLLGYGADKQIVTLTNATLASMNIGGGTGNFTFINTGNIVTDNISGTTGYISNLGVDNFTGGSGYFTSLTGDTFMGVSGHFDNLGVDNFTGGRGYFTSLSGSTGSFNNITSSTGTFSYLSVNNSALIPSTPTLTYDSWLLTNIINPPPAPSPITTISLTNDVYVIFNYPTQTKIGFFNQLVPYISGAVVRIGTTAQPITQSNYYKTYNSTDMPVQCLHFYKNSSSTPSPTTYDHTLNGTTNSYKVDNFNLDTPTTGSIYYTNNSAIVQTQVLNFTISYLDPGFPGNSSDIDNGSITILISNISGGTTNKTITITISSNEHYADVKNLYIISPSNSLTDTITYKLLSNPVRYNVNNGLSTSLQTFQTTTTTTTPAFIISSNIYPDSFYSFYLTSSNGPKSTTSNTITMDSRTPGIDISVVGGTYISTNTSKTFSLSIPSQKSVQAISASDGKSVKVLLPGSTNITGSVTFNVQNAYTTRGILNDGNNFVTGISASFAGNNSTPNDITNTWGTDSWTNLNSNITLTNSPTVSLSSNVSSDPYYGYYGTKTLNLSINPSILTSESLTEYKCVISGTYPTTNTENSTECNLTFTSDSIYYDNTINLASSFSTQTSAPFSANLLSTSDNIKISGLTVYYGDIYLNTNLTISSTYNIGNYFYNQNQIVSYKCDSNFSTTNSEKSIPPINITNNKINYPIIIIPTTISTVSTINGTTITLTQPNSSIIPGMNIYYGTTYGSIVSSINGTTLITTTNISARIKSGDILTFSQQNITSIVSTNNGTTTITLQVANPNITSGMFIYIGTAYTGSTVVSINTITLTLSKAITASNGTLLTFYNNLIKFTPTSSSIFLKTIGFTSTIYGLSSNVDSNKVSLPILYDQPSYKIIQEQYTSTSLFANKEKFSVTTTYGVRGCRINSSATVGNEFLIPNNTLNNLTYNGISYSKQSNPYNNSLVITSGSSIPYKHECLLTNGKYTNISADYPTGTFFSLQITNSNINKTIGYRFITFGWYINTSLLEAEYKFINFTLENCGICRIISGQVVLDSNSDPIYLFYRFEDTTSSTPPSSTLTAFETTRSTPWINGNNSANISTNLGTNQTPYSSNNYTDNNVSYLGLDSANIVQINELNNVTFKENIAQPLSKNSSPNIYLYCRIGLPTGFSFTGITANLSVN